jgi:hypothetical protein
MSTSVLEASTATAVIAAGLAGLAYLTRAALRFARSVLSIHDLIQRELSQNSGSSMKDELAAVAVAVGQLQGQVEDLKESKDEAHHILQTQLDSIHTHLGAPDPLFPNHRRERDDGPHT